MSKLVWKDISSFSQSDKVRAVNSVEADAGVFRLRVHRHIYYNPDDWLLSVGGLVDKRLLKSKDLEEAKAEAVEYIRKLMTNVLEAL